MASFATPHEWQVGQIFREVYEVRGILGEGGMGQVYHICVHSGPQRDQQEDMAVKRPLPTIFTRTGGMGNFVREAETWVMLGKHPYIVQCHFIETLAHVPCIFAEYMAGGSLADWIEDRESSLYRDGPDIALERILDLAIQMAWGLDYAHTQGLVHQDVKPANVLLTPQGIAKIADFGLAQARFLAGETRRSTRPGASTVVPGVGMMTVAYASPEQAEGKPLTHHTDLWSWAVSVLDLFVGAVARGYGPASAEALENYLRGANRSGAATYATRSRDPATAVFPA
jgi:serine/threonine protein kinase